MKKIAITFLVCALILTISACSNKALDQATAAVDAYNTAVEAYNEEAAKYNDGIAAIIAANDELQSAIDDCQNAIDSGEPFDPATREALEAAMEEANKAKVTAPEAIGAREALTIPENAKKEELEELTAKVEADTEELNNFEFPTLEEAPDYTETMAALSTAKADYENSVQSMKQVTAPDDNFVMQRLKTISTITDMAPVTEDHDPNGLLNKQGGYIGCVYFQDSQVDRDAIYIDDGDDVIDVGTDGGGAIEIYQTAEEAQARDEYLASFDGMGAFSSGSHYVVGTCLVRTSNALNGTQQTTLTDAITQALTNVDNG